MNGEPITIYVPKQLFEMVEKTRKKLGMNRSRFFQYCITKTLQELNVLTSNIHREEA